RPLDLRLGPPEAEGAPRHDLARRGRDDRVRVLHPRRQLVDAAPGRLPAEPGHTPCRDDLDRTGAHELDADPRFRAHDRRRRPHGVDARARGSRVAPAGALAAGGAVRARRADRPVGDARHRGLHDPDRPHAGAADDKAAADEDGRRRGALHHPERRELLAVRHRAVAEIPVEVAGLDPPAAPALGARRQLVERPRRGHQRPAGAGGAALRPRQLPPDRRRRLLDLPHHDRPRLPCRAPRRRRPAARTAARTARRLGPLPAARGVGGGDPARRQPRRLAVHRDGAPAVGRPGPAADEGRRLADGRPVVGRPDARRVHAPLRRPRRRRRPADGPRREGGARAAGLADGGRRRHAPRRAPGALVLMLLANTHGYWNLQSFWFLLIAILWIGYFVLEGFDFGVGILQRLLGRSEAERGTLIKTIGPVWDGNEVWLLTAGGATFAAFPTWYATTFSAFYLALFLVLLGLIVRGVAIEYRNKRTDPAWRARWDWVLAVSSALPALLWGVA